MERLKEAIGIALVILAIISFTICAIGGCLVRYSRAWQEILHRRELKRLEKARWEAARRAVESRSRKEND